MKLITQRGERFEYLETEEKLELFSVTQVRKVAFDTYAGIPEAQLEPARRRGSTLHRRFFFAMASRGGFCEYPPVIAGLEGYCQSMDRWIEKRKPEAVKLEEPSLNRRYRFAGTPDALLMLPHLKRGRTLTDLKTGMRTVTDSMQLCAYEHMDGYDADELLDLYLDAEGGDAKEVFVPRGKRATEWAAFLNALSILKWRTML